MISFELTDEQKIIQSMIGEFAEAELRPQARRLDDDASIDAGLLDQIWSMGIVQSGATEDEEGRSAVTNAIVLEELGAVDATLAMAVASTMGFIGAIVEHGTAHQREELLKVFLGDSFQAASLAMMESSFGFDVSNIATTATRVSDDYSLRGKKTMVPMAGKCSHFLVIAQSAGNTDAFIVPSDAPGVSIAAPKGTLGLRALELAEVSFDNVVVPASMRLGGDNGADIQQIVDASRVGISAIMAGLSRGVMTYVIPYTKERIVHGTALAKKQKIAFDIADMHLDTEAMRWMTWKAAWELETRQSATKSAQLAYTYASEHTMEIADNGLQALGGHGYTKDHPVELWYRNARALSVLEGAAGV
jgi:alkylation response protein AidB-like acyl-CoA dehydrogenase